jgi:Dolichyl-phosphate-mannose-protein mannosyltransferase
LALKWKTPELAVFLTTTRGIYLATLTLLGLFLTLSFYRAYPYLDDVNEANAAGNDWLTYKLNALSVLHDGLTMPAVQGNYHLPGGFLYNYFVAAVFALFGENSTYVYLVQAAMLALSVGLTALAFKPFLKQKTAAVYFPALALMVFVDVFVFYTFRLLSENLLLLLLPVFYLLILRTVGTSSILLASLAGAVMGLCALCRQNLILLGPTTAILLFIYLKRRPGRTPISLSFLFWFCLVFSLLPLRNYAVTGDVSIPVIRYTAQRLTSELKINDPITLTSLGRKALSAFTYYARRILFCAGLTTAMGGVPVYYLKPHWLIMWTGALIYIRRLLKRRGLEFWEAFATLFILMYLGPLIAIADIYSHGVRMIIPVMPIVLLLGVGSLTTQTSSKG